jgi:hypothetical protein
MRQINDHMKEVMGIKKQPKPSLNPKNWNWVAIITWSVILTVVALLVNLIINIIF